MSPQSNTTAPLIKAASACVWRDGKVLLARRGKVLGQGTWAFPGGRVEPGETALEAAHRELMEETGVRAGRLHLLGVYSDPARDPRGHTCSIAYLTRVSAAKARAGDDAADVAWLAISGRPSMAFDHARILNDARRLLRKMKEGKEA